jgi:hypothetical protein
MPPQLSALPLAAMPLWLDDSPSGISPPEATPSRLLLWALKVPEPPEPPKPSEPPQDKLPSYFATDVYKVPLSAIQSHLSSVL